MSSIRNTSERVMQLIQMVGGSRQDPEKVIAEFTDAELREGQIVAFEGGYMPVHFAISALRLCKQLQRGEWLPVSASRPAHGTRVWVSYLYDGQPTVDVAYFDVSGWTLDEDGIEIRPYAWMPKQQLQPAPVPT